MLGDSLKDIIDLVLNVEIQKVQGTHVSAQPDKEDNVATQEGQTLYSRLIRIANKHVRL